MTTLHDIWEELLTPEGQIALILAIIFAIIAHYSIPLLSQIIKGSLQHFRLDDRSRDILNRERIYLRSLIHEIEEIGRKTHWNDKYYIPPEADIKKESEFHIPSQFYITGSKDKDIDNVTYSSLSLMDKIRLSKGKVTGNLTKELRKIKDNVVMILGYPGSGKSVSLHHLTLEIANQESKWYKAKPTIPIFIPLGSYIGKDKGVPQNVLDFVKEQLTKHSTGGGHSAFIGERLEEYLGDGRVLFLFDAMDEMPRSDYVERYKKLRIFTEDWSQNKFVFSCRTLDYDKRFQVREIIIKEFDLSRIFKYLKKYLSSDQAKKSLNKLKTHPKMLELCSNPFFLRLISSFIQSRNDLPNNRAEIFDAFIVDFLERERDKRKKEWVGDDEFINSIARIAFIITGTKGFGTVSTEDFIKSNFANKKEFEPYTEYIDEVLDIGKKGGLLDISEFDKTVRFHHHRFQEFFTALYLDKFEEKVEFSEYYDDIWWQEVIKMYAGITNKPEELISNILLEADKFMEDNKDNQTHDVRMRVLDRIFLASLCIGTARHEIPLDIENVALERLWTFYEKGDVLERVKAIRALSNFDRNYVREALAYSLSDESDWVSDTSFSGLSKLGFDFRGATNIILKHFWRILKTGRGASSFRYYLDLLTISSGSKSFTTFAMSVLTGTMLIEISSFFGIFILVYLLSYSLSFVITGESLPISAFFEILNPFMNPYFLPFYAFIIYVYVFIERSLFKMMIGFLPWFLISGLAFSIVLSLPKFTPVSYETSGNIVEIIFFVSSIFIIYYVGRGIKKYIEIQIAKRKIASITTEKEIYKKYNGLLELIQKEESTTLKKMVIDVISNLNIPNKNILKDLRELAMMESDKEVADAMWQAIEEIERRERR